MRAVAFALLLVGQALASTASAQEPPGVSPTSPQAEDRPDVGDAPGAPVATAAVAPVAPVAPAEPWNDADMAARARAYMDTASAYNEHLTDMREQIRRLAERKYKERRAQVEANYRRQLEPVEKAERQRRLEAIDAFEGFIAQHPDDVEFLPDAMFRLAELYFEKVEDEYQVAASEYRTAYQSWKEAGGKGNAPVEPVKRFDRPISLYQKLVAQFPDYRFLDGAYYLLGYTLRQQNEEDAGLQAWKTLVERYPDSRFYPEVWFRIGKSHFEDERWEDAIAAFQRIIPQKDSDFYDKSLYQLAWAYFLINRFDDSVRNFFDLLDFSYAKKGAGGTGGSLLEDEAIQYVAISFGDDNWDRGAEYKKLIAGKSLADPDADIEVDYVRFAQDWFARTTPSKPYERDVMARLGDNLFRQSKHVQAVQALERALSLDPMNRDAPRLQDQIVQCWVRERQFDKAAAARDALVKNFGTGTAWAKRFGNDVDAMRAADDLSRSNLYGAAVYYHKQATSYFDANRQDVGVQYFKLASDAYTEYLRRYPHDKNAYEIAYYLAETFFFSLRFEDAARQYEAVRDSSAGAKYRAESALSAVYSYEKILDKAVADGALEKREIAAGARDPAKKPEEIPPLRAQFIRAIDLFLQGGEKHEMAPAFGYRAGEIFYSYGQYDEGVKRFRVVVEKYPDSEAAKFAANLILDDMVARKDWSSAASTASLFRTGTVGGQTSEWGKIEGGARFNMAKETLEKGAASMDAGRIQEGIALLESGAEQYLKLLQEDPKREYADVMMYNAALSFEKARRPVRAADLYERLYLEYPTSEKAPEAMFRVANKSEQAFNFDKAVETYLGLVKKYPTAERRADAQVDAALALEGQQQYERAAQEFERYASLFPEKPDAPDVFFHASQVQKRRGSLDGEAGVLKRFIARYGALPPQLPRVIEARVRLGDIFAEQAKRQPSARKLALDAYAAAVADYAKVEGNATAAYFAAKAAFALAEDDFASYAKLAIVARSGDKQVKELEAKSARLTEVETVYKQIITKYKAGEWSLASLYKIGSMYENMQQIVAKSPCPDDIRRQYGDIGCDEYANAIEDKAFAVEEKAVASYKIAYDKAQEFKLNNEWTRKSLEALNLLRPQDYPIDKQAISKPVAGVVEDGLGYQLPDGGAPELRALGAGPAEARFGGGA